MSAEYDFVKTSRNITDADCGATDRHDHIDGWSIRLETDGTWHLTYEHEGASSVTGYRERGTYELREGALKLLVSRARHFCDRGDPGADSEGLEWEPAEPKGVRGLNGATVQIDGESHTIHWERSDGCDDISVEKARRAELREAQRAFGQDVTRLAKKFPFMRRPEVGSVLKEAGGDAGQASAILHAKDQVAARGDQDAHSAIYGVFCKWDADGDGSISSAELERVLCEVGVPRVAEVLAAVDTDGDGCIDFEEFCTWLTGSKETARALISATSVTFRVEDKYRIPGVGDLITGCVEEGVLVPGKAVEFQPTHSEKRPCLGTVKCILKDHKHQDRADPGDTVGVHVKFWKRSRRPNANDTMVYHIETPQA